MNQKINASVRLSQHALGQRPGEFVYLSLSLSIHRYLLIHLFIHLFYGYKTLHVVLAQSNYILFLMAITSPSPKRLLQHDGYFLCAYKIKMVVYAHKTSPSCCSNLFINKLILKSLDKNHPAFRNDDTLSYNLAPLKSYKRIGRRWASIGRHERDTESHYHSLIL